MASKSPFKIELDSKTRPVVEERARAYTRHYREVVRARIVLYASQGLDNAEIARRLDTSPQVVCRWRKRFFEEGVNGLEDRARPGHGGDGIMRKWVLFRRTRPRSS